jgi:hypothetical protein|tara:strand:- start:3506 stop:3988 length:483 start_codon:yes stop_codon:yes gene_type:complete
MNNGRIDIIGKTNLDVFTLYDQIPTTDTTSDYREALTGTNSSTQLSHAYFSKENIKIIQNAIKAGVYKLSNGIFTIADQNEDTLKIIMRSIYLQNAKHGNNVRQQVRDLNKLVCDYAVPQIYGEADGYMKYKRDISTMATPIQRPISTYHNNTLETKKFF